MKTCFKLSKVILNGNVFSTIEEVMCEINKRPVSNKSVLCNFFPKINKRPGTFIQYPRVVSFSGDFATTLPFSYQLSCSFSYEPSLLFVVHFYP